MVISPSFGVDMFVNTIVLGMIKHACKNNLYINRDLTSNMDG